MWDLPMGHVPNGLLPYHGFGQPTYNFSSPPKSIPLKTWMPPPEPVPQKNWMLKQYHEFPLPPTPPTYSSAIETFYFTVKQPEHIFTTIEKIAQPSRAANKPQPNIHNMALVRRGYPI
ncbi:hypothetical protein K470DRAFT_255803 [Piedraia hortae CBS 480.64]|uniref:Uncharacterized protein n=1 Tax=Piedraia hortae CBS 480.64 TaxID=1314780 RepID=A0A6A7C4K1_9PEZI|nr:hypothetical protein K470DRAFT_255803 [Piedraia hortae CBS 480.64]